MVKKQHLTHFPPLHSQGAPTRVHLLGCHLSATLEIVFPDPFFPPRLPNLLAIFGDCCSDLPLKRWFKINKKNPTLPTWVRSSQVS